MDKIDPKTARPALRLKDCLAMAAAIVTEPVTTATGTVAIVTEPVTTATGTVAMHGAIHRIRDMGGFSFLMVRLPDTLIQCVLSGAICDAVRPQLHEECCVRMTGRLVHEERAPHGLEYLIDDLQILSTPAEPMPFAINKRKPGQSLETELGLRPIVLRNSNRRARFRIQEGVVRGFRDYLLSQGFTEIRSPKLLSASAEGGANVFSMDYFGQKAFLAQSPQFYKQTMVGVYERVFEVGSVFRAERHNTARHLNEYVSLDFEMGYIEGFEDICAQETAMLAYLFDFLKREYAEEIALLGIEVPMVGEIPQVRFREAKELVSKAYNRKIKDPYDLEPEEEHLIGEYFKEQTGSDFVFVTHYPTKKRPFYAMNDPEDPKVTLSFDLLFRGLEVTTGGQRIHDYHQQVAKMIDKGLDPEEFASYLMIHRYGMPPHGGLGIGLERLCMKLFGDTNIRLSSMFPRDMSRLDP